MSKHKPGINREQRISKEGLHRLEAQLARGTRISAPVLAQWIKRYGEAAREIIRRYDQYTEKLD